MREPVKCPIINCLIDNGHFSSISWMISVSDIISALLLRKHMCQFFRRRRLLLVLVLWLKWNWIFVLCNRMRNMNITYCRYSCWKFACASHICRNAERMLFTQPVGQSQISIVRVWWISSRHTLYVAFLYDKHSFWSVMKNTYRHR